MGEIIELEAWDSFDFTAYEAAPTTTPHRGGLVIVQEIFGVNAHIRSVADNWAKEGYYCVVPALFDREKRGIEYAYDADGMEAGRSLVMKLGFETMLMDIQSAVIAASSAGRVGVVGYCLGGSLAWLAATRLERVSAASCYYGRHIVQYASEAPNCPVQMHFGESDGMIPMSDVEAVRAAVPPEVEIFTYPGGHAFNRDGHAGYEAQSAAGARERTLALLRKHVD